MEFIFEAIFEGFFECILDGFLNLSYSFIPDSVHSKKVKNIVTLIVAIIAMVMFTGLVFGIALLIGNGGRSFWGWLLVSITVAYVIVGIILTIIGRRKKRKE